MPGTLSVNRIGDQNVDALLTGLRWNTATLTYSFPTSSSFYGTGYPASLAGFEVLNGTQQAAVRTILGMYASVSNLRFSPVTESATTHGDLRFAMSNGPGTAFAYYPSTGDWGGDSFYENSGGKYDDPVLGNYAWHTFIHEIGHAVGLKHGQTTDVYGSMTFARDSMEFSVMTYRSYVGAALNGYTNETWGFAQTLMMYDIAALQYMYGANFSYNAGTTVYKWSPTTGALSINGVSQAAPGGNRVFMTVWDGGGNDTYDLSNYTNGVTIDLRPGEWTTTSAVQLANLGSGFARGNIANALLFNGDTRSLIENAIGGSGNDTLIGNVASNSLDGRGGSDTVVLAGIRANYAFSGTLLSFSATGLGATDTILNVEFVRFLGSNETIAVTDLVRADDFRDSIGDATAPLGALAMNASVIGVVEVSGDADVFAVNLVAGQRTVFDLRGTAGSAAALANPLLQLRNGAGTVLLSNDNSNGTNNSQIVFTATVSGTYYLSALGSGTVVGSYTLSARNGADDYRNSIADSTAPLGALAANGTRTGTIEGSSDADVFAVTLAAGQSYTFDLRGSSSGGGTLVNPSLELRNASGTLLLANDDFNGSSDSRMVFTASVAGTYYIVARATGLGIGTYTLGARTNSDDYRDTISDTTAPLGTLAFNGTRQGAIEVSGDSDVFAITLTGGQSYTFELRGLPGGSGTLPDPFLELRNGAGTLVATNDNANGTANAQITYTPTTTGTYYLTADAVGTATGTYTLLARGSDDYRDSITDVTAPFGSVSVNGTRQGNIETSGDSDVFAVTLAAGQSYTIDVRGSASSGGTLANPALTLRNSTGTLLGSNDNFNGLNDSRILFVAPAAGTYYVTALGSGTGTGTYTVSVRSTFDDFRDGISDTTAPLGSLGVNGTRQGAIETVGDSDLFAISLVAGQVYTFSLRGSPSGGGNIPDPVLQLRNSAGTLLLSNDDSNGTLDSQITYTATASGTFYLSANGYGPSVGTYTLSARTAVDDFRDSVTDTSAPLGTIAVNGVRTGTIETNGDTDVFAITLAAGQVYTFTLRGTSGGGGSLGDPMLQLRNSAGTLLLSNDDSNGTNDSQITYTATASGTFYLVADGYGSATGTYTLGATTGADDYRDSITDTTSPLGSLAVGGTRQGTIEIGGDTDVFAISLTAGQSYTFSLRGSGSGGGTLADPLLQLRNSAGTLLASNDDFTGLDSRITFTASASGTYYLVADGYSTGIGTYTLSATSNSAADDFRDTISDTTAPLGTLAVGGSRQGNVEVSGDADVFAVTLVAGQGYTFNLRGSPGGGGSLSDTVLELRNAAGVLLLSNDDSNGTNDSQISYTATAGGTFYLTARAFSTLTGTYTLNAAAGALDDYRDSIGDTAAPLGSLTVGGSRSGGIEVAGDADVFAVTLTAGQTYTFNLRGSSTGGGTLPDPVLELRNGAGTLLLWNDDWNGTTDSHIVYTASANGTYYLSASGFNLSAGTYTLSASLGASASALGASGIEQLGFGAAAPESLFPSAEPLDRPLFANDGDDVLGAFAKFGAEPLYWRVEALEGGVDGFAVA